MISLMIKMCNLLIIQSFQIAFYLQQSDFPNIDHNNLDKYPALYIKCSKTIMNLKSHVFKDMLLKYEILQTFLI